MRRKPIYSLINAFKCVGGILEVRPIQNVSQKPDIWILVKLAKRKAPRTRGKARVLVLPDGVSAKHVAKDSMRQRNSKQENED